MWFSHFSHSLIHLLISLHVLAFLLFDESYVQAVSNVCYYRYTWKAGIGIPMTSFKAYYAFENSSLYTNVLQLLLFHLFLWKIYYSNIDSVGIYIYIYIYNKYRYDLGTLFRVEYVNMIMAINLPHFICLALKVHYLQIWKPKQKEIFTQPACYHLIMPSGKFYFIISVLLWHISIPHARLLQ